MDFSTRAIQKRLAWGRAQLAYRWKWVGVFGIVVIALSVAGVTWSRARSSGPEATGREVKAMVASVARHIIVKTSEEPTIATVEDPTVLRAQNPIFYQDAEKGDRLYVWTDKAVLYSPKKDKILAVLPINYPAPTAAAANPAPTNADNVEALSIEVRNGSGIPGLGKMFGARIKKLGMNATVNGNAKNAPYAHTVIVKKSAQVTAKTLESLISMTKGEVTALPAGEDASNSDILVIVGADYTQ